jgi:predicted SAM-dependent methyltransferase
VSELRLHIGGQHAKEGWKILNVQAGPGVDYVGTCTDLSAFADGSVAEIYASHVLEHLSYTHELPQALKEFQRVLKPGGTLRVSVPDFEKLARIFLLPELTPQLRFHVMRMVFGGQMDAHDFHKVGLTGEFLGAMLVNAGFGQLSQVESFGEFDDSSELRIGPNRVSLNVIAQRS